MTRLRPEDRAFNEEIARRVRLHRRYQKLTQWQLGDRAAVSRAFISMFETGRHGVEVAALRRIAHGLSLTLPSLVVEPGEERLPWPAGPEEDSA